MKNLVKKSPPSLFFFLLMGTVESQDSSAAGKDSADTNSLVPIPPELQDFLEKRQGTSSLKKKKMKKTKGRVCGSP